MSSEILKGKLSSEREFGRGVGPLPPSTMEPDIVDASAGPDPRVRVNQYRPHIERTSTRDQLIHRAETLTRELTHINQALAVIDATPGAEAVLDAVGNAGKPTYY